MSLTPMSQGTQQSLWEENAMVYSVMVVGSQISSTYSLMRPENEKRKQVQQPFHRQNRQSKHIKVSLTRHIEQRLKLVTICPLKFKHTYFVL